MRNKLAMIFLTAAVLVAGCTANERARGWGGTETIKLEQGQKLVTTTWKESNMWILTRPMKEGETAETYTFKEKSAYGLVEGTVTIVEVK